MVSGFMNKYLEYFRYDLWRVMRPLAFHGSGKSGPYFEGWYFKLVSLDGAQRLSIIPGIYIGKDHQDDHAFIQIIDGVSGKSDFYPFPYDQFSFVPGKMDVRVGKNHFTRDGINLDLDLRDMRLSGQVVFQSPHTWPVSILSPGVMGWFAWVPGMGCYHGIVSMDHALSGSLTLNGKQFNFSGGRGYMEKDWGRAMPSAWIWMQCNHFDQPQTSLSFSIADIPWGKRSFDGFLGGLLFNGELYRFATYTGARVTDLTVDDKVVRFSVHDRRKLMDIIASREAGSVLQAPTTLQMDRRIMETLSARIEVAFSERIDGRWVQRFAGQGRHAGLEVVGDLSLVSSHP